MSSVKDLIPTSAAHDVFQVKYGERRSRKSIVFHGFAASGEPDADQDMDYAFWVVRGGESVILVDTGYPIDERDWLGEVSRTPSPQGLALLDIEPEDVDMVVATHFHYDHVGYVHLFPNAEIVAAQTEFDYWTARFAENGLEGEFVEPANYLAIVAAGEEGRLRLVTEVTEVHPGISVVPVGGHCPGQLIAVVQSGSGPLILASDAVHLYEQVERGWAFFAHTDLDEMLEALALVNRLSEETGAKIIPGHDPRVAAEHEALDGPARHVVSRLG